MTHETYTQEEISTNINTLTHQLDDLILTRKDINEQVRDKRKQVKYWEEMNLLQYKMFEDNQ